MTTLFLETIFHTEGPWHYEYLPYNLSDLEGTVVTELPNYRIYPCGETAEPENWIAQTNEDLSNGIQEANARLIAAAPDMREALLDIKRIAGKSGDADTDAETLLWLIADRVQEVLNLPSNARRAS